MILVPIAALFVGPRLWVARVLKQHNRKDVKAFRTGGELARELLDHHQLQHVKVEITDLGDHYDPVSKAVRLTRDKFNRKTLAAVTTAAHEVAHAIQDATAYSPFVLRARLATVAKMAVQAGTVVLVAVPAASLASRRPISPVFMGTAVIAMLGTGVAVQLVTLPTELNASFQRALPMLREGYINEMQAKDARIILLASSLTYVASSLLAVLHVWPWLGRPPMSLVAGSTARLSLPGKSENIPRARSSQPRGHRKIRRSRSKGGGLDGMIRLVGKPLIRSYLQIRRARGRS